MHTVVFLTAVTSAKALQAMKKIHLRVTFIQGMNFIPLTRKKMLHSRLRRSCKRSLERYHSKGHRIKLVYLCYLHSRGSKGQLWGSCSTEPAEKCHPVHTDPEAHTPWYPWGHATATSIGPVRSQGATKRNGCGTESCPFLMHSFAE